MAIMLTKRILKNSFNFGLGSVLPKVIGFFFIPIYTFYLSPEQYGIVEICVSLTSLVLVILKLGIPGSVPRFYFDNENKIKYISTIFWLLFFIALVQLGFVLFFGKLYLHKIYPNISYDKFFIFLALTAFFQSIIALQKSVLLAKEESVYNAKLNIFSSFTSIFLVMSLVVLFKLKALSFVLGAFFTSIIILIQTIFYFKDDLKLHFDWKIAYPALIWGISILPGHLIHILTPLANKTLLINFQSLHELGVYSLALRLLSPLIILATAIDKAYTPIYYQNRLKNDKNNNEFRNSLNDIWIFTLIIFLLSYLLSPYLMILVPNSEFHVAAKIFPILSISYLFNMAWIIFGKEIFFQKKTYLQPIIGFIASILNLAFVAFNIKDLGFYALAIGHVIFWIVFVIAGILFHIKNDLKIFKLKFYFTSFSNIVIIVIIFEVIKKYFFNMQLVGLLLSSLICYLFSFYYLKKTYLK